MFFMCIIQKHLIPDTWGGNPSPSRHDRSRFRPWCDHCTVEFWRPFGATTWHGINFLCSSCTFSLYWCCSKTCFSKFCRICQLFCPGIHCLQMKALKDLGLDVTKGTVATDTAVTKTKFHIMRLWVLATLCLLYFSYTASTCLCLCRKLKRAFTVHARIQLSLFECFNLLSAQCQIIYACACISFCSISFLDYTPSLYTHWFVEIMFHNFLATIVPFEII